ncbi:MAG: hypothetical protein ABS92_12435 [Thiobacillus sp. SCN 63-374]|nr:MAG: hypothetical protein ABS92_12435 [Thiobacillus sp. SCN 63-374]
MRIGGKRQDESQCAFPSLFDTLLDGNSWQHGHPAVADGDSVERMVCTRQLRFGKKFPATHLDQCHLQAIINAPDRLYLAIKQVINRVYGLTSMEQILAFSQRNDLGQVAQGIGKKRRKGVS